MSSGGGSGGFLLSLVTESFAVRALLGSLAAALLAALLVGMGAVRTRRARRAVLLTPVLTAAVAGLASVGEVYLPQLWVATTTATAGSMLDLFGEQRGLITDRGLDVLVLAYSIVAAVLVARRGVGLVTVRRALRRARPVPPDDIVMRETTRLANQMGIRPPPLMLLERCPGGAFTAGVRRPVIALDPDLLGTLDEQELEGLLAHELAHIARHDTALGSVIGLFRDLSFFLPPLHAAVRWLRREQEEGADELASLFTGRPGALASSILKVWDCSRDRRHLPAVCAVTGRLACPSGVVALRPLHRRPLEVLTARVERLIARTPAPTRLRQSSELLLASLVLAAGTTAALSIPTWIATDLESEALSFAFLSAPIAGAPVESPAFATFRALTPEHVTAASAAVGVGGASTRGCPCVESQADLLRGEPAAGTNAPQRLAWGSAELPPWSIVAYEDAVVRTARPVLALTESGPQVGLFLVSRPNS